MQKKKRKLKRRSIITSIIVSLVAIAAIVSFIVCINWIMANTAARGRESLQVFAKQTSLRFEDMLENDSIVLKQLKLDITAKSPTTVNEVLPTLQTYQTTWSSEEVGLLFEDETAVGRTGNAVVFENWIDPLTVEAKAYGVSIVGNRVGEDQVLSFSIPAELNLDSKKCIGFFINFPLDKINTMMENTEYGNNSGTFISIIRQSGDTIWRSDMVDGDKTNMFDDLENAKFESSGELIKIKSRLELNYSGTSIYTTNSERRVLAYIPLTTNYWRLIISLPYDTVIEQSSNNIIALVMVAAIVVIVSLFIAFYFIYRQRSTELKKKRAELKAAHALSAAKAKSDFLSRMSHELRTPLNGIIGMAELASRNGDNKAKREDYLSKIKTSSEFLVSLINDILDMAKIDNDKMTFNIEPFNVKTLCDSVSDIFEPMTIDKNLEFVMDYSGLKHDTIIGDEMRLKQVLINLLSNAVKFTDAGTVKCILDQVVIGEKSRIRIRVSDTGCGISQENIERIFKPFEQETTIANRTKTGTGLGLSICVSLIKLAGGEITVESKVGEGSLFTVILPLDVADNEILGEVKTSSKDIRLSSVKILLAEDNDLNAEIATALLSDAGAKITRVSNGVEAVERFISSDVGEFDVILMDILMPQMDGVEAAQKIRSSGHAEAATIPIIAMTANAMSEDRDLALAAGMNDHISKPIYIDKMCKVIRQYCKKKN